MTIRREVLHGGGAAGAAADSQPAIAIGKAAGGGSPMGERQEGSTIRRMHRQRRRQKDGLEAMQIAAAKAEAAPRLVAGQKHRQGMKRQCQECWKLLGPALFPAGSA